MNGIATAVFDARGHDRLASVREHHHVARLDVRGGMFKGAEVVAVGRVERVDEAAHDRHGKQGGTAPLDVPNGHCRFLTTT